MEAASSTRTVNMTLVEDQLAQDLNKMAAHKGMWKKRWILCCCCNFIIILASASALTIFFAIGNWTQMNFKCDWEGRADFGAVYLETDKSIVLAGGTDKQKNFADVWKSKDKGVTWTRVVDVARFGPRHGHALLQDAKSGTLFVIAGDSESPSAAITNVLNDVWKSDDGREWTLQNPSAPWAPRKFMGACVDSAGHFFIIGGMGGYKGGGLNDMWKSEDLGVSWSSVTRASPWSARYGFSFVRVPAGPVDGRFYVIGGHDGRVQHDVWKSDDSGSTWQKMRFTHVREMTFSSFEDRASWSPRYGAVVEADSNGLLSYIGGSTGDELVNDVWQLESPENRNVEGKDGKPLEWKLDGAPEWKARWGHQSIMDEDGKIYIFGGADEIGCFRDIWKKERSLDVNNLRHYIGGEDFGSEEAPSDEEGDANGEGGGDAASDKADSEADSTANVGSNGSTVTPPEADNQTAQVQNANVPG